MQLPWQVVRKVGVHIRWHRSCFGIRSGVTSALTSSRLEGWSRSVFCGMSNHLEQNMSYLIDKMYQHFGRSRVFGRWLEKRNFARPFDKSLKKMLLLYHQHNATAFSQIYPFLYYAEEIAAEFGISVRAIPVESVNSALILQADVIAFQTDFAIADYQLRMLLRGLRDRNSRAGLVYLDWFAPLDLRFAETVNPYIELYVKRQLFTDISAYNQPTLGETNLTDYYNRYYNLEAEERCFHVPADFLPKLVLGPSLMTGDHLLAKFASGNAFSQNKSIDVHARFSCTGTSWYWAMRHDALMACANLQPANIVAGDGVPKKTYLRELEESKMCLSPFGYGEICWRDYEAAMCGALLLKPDVSHLRSSPDLFVKNETYVPVAWDWSDLQEKVEFYINNERERNRIVRNAREVLISYFAETRFLHQMSPLFELAYTGGVLKPSPVTKAPMPANRKATHVDKRRAMPDRGVGGKEQVVTDLRRTREERAYDRMNRRGVW